MSSAWERKSWSLTAWGDRSQVVPLFFEVADQLTLFGIDADGRQAAPNSPLSEAHDSGLCAASLAVRAGFARDLDNTLAKPELNRYEKRAHDAADWLPPLNRCWFAKTVIAVRQGVRTDDSTGADPDHELVGGDSTI